MMERAEMEPPSVKTTGSFNNQLRTARYGIIKMLTAASSFRMTLLFALKAGSSMAQLKSRVAVTSRDHVSEPVRQKSHMIHVNIAIRKVADNAIKETCRNFSNLSFVLRLEY